ncbi:transposable element Tcb1 transposase [Trichonephila clavipes]|nr:transposable element Tcb1 transposase [Trichonephila clavipes]
MKRAPASALRWRKGSNLWCADFVSTTRSLPNQSGLSFICTEWSFRSSIRVRQRKDTGLPNSSHPPQCTTSREDRRIVRMAVTDRSVTSRTIAHHIESVTHHSVSARTIRRRLQQSGLSARRLLCLSLTQNHIHLRR